jgi:hypothetical protein
MTSQKSGLSKRPYWLPTDDAALAEYFKEIADRDALISGAGVAAAADSAALTALVSNTDAFDGLLASLISDHQLRMFISGSASVAVAGNMPALDVSDTANQTVSTLAIISAWATTEFQKTLPSPSSGVFTPGIAGRYSVSAYLQTAAGSGVASYIELRKNATAIARDSDGASGSNGSHLNVATEVVLTASDTLSLFAFRSASGAVSTRRMALRYLGPAA